MKRLRFAPQALADLASIEDHSRERWGNEQARAYLETIKLRLDRIATRPAIGVACDDVLAGLRRASVGSHMIFYDEGDNAIVVNRILHQRMDYRSHLRGLPETDS